MADQRLPSLAARHFAELVLELGPLVRDTLVREVEPLPPRGLLLVLQPAGGPDVGPAGEADDRVRRLRLSADPSFARLHLQLGRVRRHRGPHGPFFQALRSTLQGARLSAIEALEGERIVSIEFVDPSGHGHTLVLEAIGRHGNLLLCDAERRIREVLVPARARPAAPPRKPSPRNPQDAREARDEALASSAPQGAAERLARGAPYRPPVGGSAPPALPLASSLPEPPDPEATLHAGLGQLARRVPLSWRVECCLGHAGDRALAEELRRDLMRRLRRRLKAARRKRAGLEAQERDALEADQLQRNGELLLAQHASLKRGSSAVEVTDHFEPQAPPRIVELDPKRSGRENAERFFARAKKLRKAAERLPADLERAREDEQALEGLLSQAQDPAVDPFLLEERSVAEGRVAHKPVPKSAGKQKQAPPARLPYRVFRGSRGGEIRVGRSARDNDELTFRASRGSDVWLHTADAPGSHVVLRIEKGREPDADELLDAAHLAVHFSPLAGTRKADVHVARCKEVKKPKRAPAGLVTLAGGRTLRVRMDEERLQRLLRGTPAPGEPPREVAGEDGARPGPGEAPRRPGRG